jgi:hypothetical protein
MMEAGGADFPGFEGVPHVAAITKPEVVLAGRPAAERASDSRTGWLVALVLIGLAINNNRLVILDGTHPPILLPQL